MQHNGVVHVSFLNITHIFIHKHSGTPDDNLALVWDTMVEFWKDNPQHGRSRFFSLQLSMFTDPTSPLSSFPKLKGKGAEVRHLVPALQYAWDKLVMTHNADNQMYQYISLGLASSSKIDIVLDQNSSAYKLEGAALQAYQSSIFAFLTVQNALAVHYNAHGYKLFNITPKSHYLAHSAVQAAYLNPRFAWCFGGEDFMQTMKRIGGMCACGTSIYKRSDSVLERYSAGMHFLLTPVDQWWR